VGVLVHFTHLLEVIRKAAAQLQVTGRNMPEHLSILVLMLNNIISQKNVQQYVNCSAMDKNLEMNTEGRALQ
jgi:hypothetical protein